MFEFNFSRNSVNKTLGYIKNNYPNSDKSGLYHHYFPLVEKDEILDYRNNEFFYREVIICTAFLDYCDKLSLIKKVLTKTEPHMKSNK